MMSPCEFNSRCWGLLFDPASPLHSALADRGLALHVSTPDTYRHLLKVYSKVHFVARQKHDLYTFPNLDVFLSRSIRCNVSSRPAEDQPDGGWYLKERQREGRTEEEVAQAREKREKELVTREEDIWAYHSYPDEFRHGCSEVDPFNHQSYRDLYPQRRYKLGPTEMWGPNNGAAVLTRGVSRRWETHLHRSSESHMLGDARDDELEAELARIRSSKPFKPCHMNVIEMQAEERAWALRPALPMVIVTDEQRKDVNERRHQMKF